MTLGSNDASLRLAASLFRQKFIKRIVKTGVMRDGFTGILGGLELGELAATSGSLYIANQFSITQ